MQKVRHHMLTEAIQPTNNGITSNTQEGCLLPPSYPTPGTSHNIHASTTLSPSQSVNLKHLSGVSSPSPSILVIDDSQTIRKIIETALGREGYATITFPDGIAALRWLAAVSCPPPRLVLLDIELPKMDGYAIVRTLKAKPALENMAIIMMSRRNGIIDHLKGRLVGAKHYLTKPFTTEVLVGTVRQYLGCNTDGTLE